MKQFIIQDKYGNIVCMGDTRDCAKYFNESVKVFNNAAWYAKKGVMHKECVIKEYKKNGSIHNS